MSEPAEPPSPGASESHAAPAGLSLRVNVLWTFFGWFVFGAAQWAVLAVLAKLGNKAVVGQYALGLAVATPVMVFGRLHLRAVQATDQPSADRFGHYLRLTVMTTVGAMLVVVAVLAVAGYPPETSLLVCVIALGLASESLSEVTYGLMQQRERMDRIAISMSARGLLALVALAVVMSATGSVVWAALAMAGAYLAVLVLFDWRGVRQMLGHSEPIPLLVWTEDERRILRTLALQALPLGIVTLMLALNLNIPRYYVEHELGVGSLGLFAAMASLTVPGKTIALGLAQAATPRMARYFATGDLRRFRLLVAKLSAITLLVGLGGLGVVAIAGDQVLRILYTPEYVGHNGVLVLLMAATTVTQLSTIVSAAVIAMRRFWVPLPVYAVTLVAVFVTALTSIAHLGLAGAGYALLVSAVIPTVVFGVFTIRAR